MTRDEENVRQQRNYSVKHVLISVWPPLKRSVNSNLCSAVQVQREIPVEQEISRQ